MWYLTLLTLLIIFVDFLLMISASSVFVILRILSLMRCVQTILSTAIVLIFSSLLTLGQGKDNDDNLSSNISMSHDCCSGPISLGATGAAAAKWAQYLGQYKPTKQKHEGAPVYQNQNGKYLYHHTKGQWRTNNVINKRGVFKSEGSRKAACVSPKSKWYFWDEEWRRGDIKVSCDQDTVMIEPQQRGKLTKVIMIWSMSWNIQQQIFQALA